MNVKAKLSSDDIARACAEAMWKEDDASQGLGMTIVEVRPGQATLSMMVQPHMVNGQRIAHIVRPRRRSRSNECPTHTSRFANCASTAMRSQSSTLVANGFSTNTCLPA